VFILVVYLMLLIQLIGINFTCVVYERNATYAQLTGSRYAHYVQA
jgi:hypothetical protein